MLAPDTVLNNRYRIIRQLGKGGMGAVYEALDVELSCPVAVKETFAESEEMRRQFKREASLLANLRHAALPKVTDHFTLKNGQFLVMEFIPGKDLMQMLEERAGPFFPADVLHWADVLLDALSYIHRRDPPVIHRDVKPSNLKLTTEGQIILLDFGLAKGRAGEMSSLNSDQGLPGYTPGYAPLEQILQADVRWIEALKNVNDSEVRRVYDEPTDARSDLFALGATLYHLMTNSIPRAAPNRAQDVWAGRPDPVLPADHLNSQITPAVAAALMRSIRLNRADRFGTATEMRQALREAAQAPFSFGSKPSKEVFFDQPTELDRITSTQPTLAESVATAPAQVNAKYGLLGRADGAVRSVAFSPDGRWVASGSNDNTVRLWDVQTGEGRILGRCDQGDSGVSYVSTVSFAPDGKGVASGSYDKTVRVWDVRTGEGRVLGNFAQQVRVVAYSPDGRVLAAGGDDGAIRLLDVHTGQSRVLGKCVGTVWAVAFSPDGNTLAAESDDQMIRLWDLNTSQTRTLDSRESDVRSLAFSPDGQRLALGGWDQQIRLLDVRTNEATALGKCDAVVRSVAFSPDGKHIVSGGDDHTLRLWEVATGQARIVGSCDYVVAAVAFSPDGRSIASGSWDKTVWMWKSADEGD